MQKIPSAKRLTPWRKAALALVVALAVAFALWHGALRPAPEMEPPKNPPVAVVPAAVSTAVSTATNHSTTWPPPAGPPKRQFAVFCERDGMAWAAEDGRDTNVIRRLAHNDLEYQRMVDENARIFRRQLVYLNETAAAVFERAKLTGTPVQRLTLPGIDGQELLFEIVKSDGNGSSRQGMFSGHLVGNLDSQVSLAFQDGREAFTILSPKENIYIVGEPREPGEVIVKRFDPEKYGVAPTEGDDFIKTDSTNK